MEFATPAKRRQPERRFKKWDELPNDGRRYWHKIPGRRPGWQTHYCLEVNAPDKPLRFWQKIYNPGGRLVERHEKLPVGTGHQHLP